MNLSILIPLLNEEESLNELYTWIIKVMQTNNYTYEIIFLDDGSTDNSWQCIEQFAQENPHVKGIRFMKNFGKSQALHAGFAKAQGDVIITMDADLQDSPEEIPGLYDMIINGNYDLVSGWKKKRYDSVVAKNIPSKLFNWAARKTSGVYLNDFNCGLKAYKNVVVKNVEVSGEMHRYIPVLAKNAGFNKIGEKVVQHQARKYGESKFGMSRFINGFLDLITIWFLSRYGKRPMHFFGAIGFVSFGFGTLAGLIAIALKLFSIRDFVATPLPIFTALFIIVGVQLIAMGVIAEILMRVYYESQNKTPYRIAETINL